MPILPSSLSSINSKVNSARKTFNSSLDKAGEKSGIFKSSSSSTTTHNNQNSISSNQTSGGNPPYQPKSTAPPPPPPRRYDSNQPASSNTSINQNYGPPPSLTAPPRYVASSSNPSNTSLDQNYGPPPPPPAPPRRLTSTTSNTSLNRNYGPPPPPRRLASTTSNTALNQNYGPPPPAPPRRLTPNPSSNSLNQSYGPPPPAPPRRLTPNPSNNSLNQTYEPPPPVSAKPVLSSYSRPPLPTSNASAHQTKFESNPPNLTFLQPGLKKSSIPYPPFSKFTESDKLSFFALLDEFFNVQSDSVDQTVSPPSLSSTPPPPISIHNKPRSTLNQFEAKYPTTISSKDLATYFLNHHLWTSNQDQWYTLSDPIPNPILNLTDIKRMSSWKQTGSIRHQFNYILFSDLSQLWSSIIFNTQNPFPPQEVKVKYRPTPSIKDVNQLTIASETYSDYLLQYLEGVENRKTHVGRGECWDLANEALKAIPSFSPHLPLPLTSINRTHGWLLYHGEANGLGNGVGHWLPECIDQIRPGDVIEWKLVSCNTIHPTLMCKLGDPDHTAMILDVKSSNITNRFIPPSQLGQITVLEQSLKQLPIRRTYDLSTISAGSVWIYRPDSEKNLLGLSANSCDWPPKGYTLSS
ncbi:uncharacterized protein MELLADRAFT_101031 [Melampsora larici-populina 98AG31]|uniref:BBC1/AIM3 cysteine proteinase-fold domain-containing protein n=1 Tax=Melampsora larici-populina (strain 98AG31 / pathotype 3-4-7) TaxID=747676 RepID=F4R3E4_MELLP|nr:uncharacterized protein MELLADRAFT_101031 [Melampsora larici-populina 98AG31]EGG12615.1 hypothetical protein MELLADRAFT_101031 [Melampsora larici-populina 98AG31]